MRFNPAPFTFLLIAQCSLVIYAERPYATAGDSTINPPLEIAHHFEEVQGNLWRAAIALCDERQSEWIASWHTQSEARKRATWERCNAEETRIYTAMQLDSTAYRAALDREIAELRAHD